MLTELETENGPAYVDLMRVVFIGHPVTKRGKEESRMVNFGGGYLFVLNNKANYRVLRDLLPNDAPSMVTVPVEKPKRKKKTTDAEKA